jgi:hypothetical protein
MDFEEANNVGMQRNANDALEFTHGCNLLPCNAALDAFDGTLNRCIVVSLRKAGNGKRVSEQDGGRKTLGL